MTCGSENTQHGELPRNGHADGDCEDSADPMNVLFLNERTSDLGDAIRQITNGETGKRWKSPSWHGIVTARDQRAQFGDDCNEQDDQVVAGSFWARFHIRFWDLPNGNVIAGAHHEFLLTIGGNLPFPHPHQPDSFDSGKTAICDDFLAAGRIVNRKAIPMNNAKVVPHCDGIAALIR